MDRPEARGSLLSAADFWIALVWLALSLFVTWAGRDLGIGSAAAPDSGFLLFWTGLLMCGFSLAILWGAVAGGGPSFASLWTDVRWGKVILMIAALATYAAVLDTLGFLLATIPLLLVLLRGVDPVRWTIAVPVAVVPTLGIWWVLKRLLLIRLPAGVFGLG